MKPRFVFVFGIVVALLALFASGCSLSGPDVSIEDRIKDFESDVKRDNWGSLSSHIHPDNGKKDQANDRTYWENVLDGPNYNFTNISNSGDNRNVTVENNNSTNYHPANDTWSFKMKEDKDGPLSRSSWYIDGITSSGGVDPLP